MDTRNLGYIGLGVLVGIIVATLLGVPPFLWISAAIVAVVATAAMVLARSAGISDAARVVTPAAPAPEPAVEAAAPLPPRSVERSTSVESELVRPASDDADTPAVWLHWRGGRRVHRFEDAQGWVVERVSTKDPDNPRKRVIGEPLTFATEADAVAAADELAQGRTPHATERGRPNLAPARA